MSVISGTFTGKLCESHARLPQIAVILGPKRQTNNLHLPVFTGYNSKRIGASAMAVDTPKPLERNYLGW
jgi:hypothetical protein